MCFPPLPAAALLEMQSTPNYLWSTEDLLGQGATACVYKARNKVSGGTGGEARHPKTTVPLCPLHPSCPAARGCPCSPLLALPGAPRLPAALGAASGFIFVFHLAPSPPTPSAAPARGCGSRAAFGVARSRVRLIGAAVHWRQGGRSCFWGNAQRF